MTAVSEPRLAEHEYLPSELTGSVWLVYPRTSSKFWKRNKFFKIFFFKYDYLIKGKRAEKANAQSPFKSSGSAFAYVGTNESYPRWCFFFTFNIWTFICIWVSVIDLMFARYTVITCCCFFVFGFGFVFQSKTADFLPMENLCTWTWKDFLAQKHGRSLQSRFGSYLM